MQSYSSPLRRAVGLLSMMRLQNCIMMGFAVIVGEAIASEEVPAQSAFYGFVTGFCLLAASMVINDYFDREIDAINQPKRPIPTGLVRPPEAISFAMVLSSVGLLFAAYSGPYTLLIAVTSMSLMLAYNARIKKHGLLGNAFVSTNVAIPFVYGGFAVGNPTWSLIIFTALAFLSSMGREIVKGIADLSGDAVKGVKSVAATKGNAYAAKLGGVLFLAAVALSGLPPVFGLVSYYYLPLVAVCDIGFILSAYSVLIDPSSRNAERNKKYVLAWMIFGLLAFVLGTF